MSSGTCGPSRSRSSPDLLLFADEQAVEPVEAITLDRHRHRTYHYWHAFVPDSLGSVKPSPLRSTTCSPTPLVPSLQYFHHRGSGMAE